MDQKSAHPVTLLPLPQRVAFHSERLTVTSEWVLNMSGDHPLLEQAATLIQRVIENRLGQPLQRTETLPAGGPCIHMEIKAGTIEPDHPEGYRLDITPRQIRLQGNTPAGIYYAAQTLAQILDATEGLQIPALTVEDWPDYAHRGLYIESFWGTDRMVLEDWQRTIDMMADLKLNLLGIGLYGCWEIKHHRVLTEFFLVPLERHPALKTPQTIRYFDPTDRRWTSVEYLPTIYEQDLLNEIIPYARERNIQVLPHFGGPGHNTVIPRIYPEVSAKTAAGKPSGYGYCVSNPATFELLYDILDEIIQRYMQPHGLTMLHIAGDEVYPIRNVDPDNPEVEISPWCQCPACRSLSEYQQLSRYLLQLAGFLQARDITTFVWADSLARMGRVNDFIQAARERDLLENMVMQWWCYKEPLPALTSTTQMATWVMPSCGLIANIFYQDFSSNLYRFLRHGWQTGARGTHAYNVPDPAFHKNYHCLAEFAWNQSNSGGLAHFNIRYAQRYFGDDWPTVLEALDTAERVFGSYPLMVYILDPLLRYFNTYPWGQFDYPADLLAEVAGDPLSVIEALRQSAAILDTAKALLARIELRGGGRDLIEGFVLECDRVTAVIDGVLTALTVLANYLNAMATFDADRGTARKTVARCAAEMQRTLDRNLAVMTQIQERKRTYLVPSTLREVSYLVSFLHDLTAELADIETAFDTLDALPQFPILDHIDREKLLGLWHPWEF